MTTGVGRTGERNDGLASVGKFRLKAVQRVWILFSVCVAISVSVSAAQDVADYTGKTVSQIRVVVEGSGSESSGEGYRREIQIREGLPYSLPQIRNSLSSLLTSGLASNARAEAEPGPNNTVILTFTVAPLARVGTVDFTGIDSLIPADDLRTRLGELERGNPYSEAAVRNGADEILEVLRDLGYYQASIEHNVTIDPAFVTARITYNITPGAIAQVSQLTIGGNPKIPVAQLQAAMQAGPGTPFSRSQLNADVQRLLSTHLNAGYLNARIGPPEVNYDRSANAVTIRIPIESGSIYTARVEGYEISAKKLRETVPLLRDGGVDQSSLEQGADRLQTLLQEVGYFFAEVEPPPLPDPSLERAELVFKVDPKERYRLTSITIEGTTNLVIPDILSELRSKTESFFPIPIFSKYTRGLTSEDAMRRDAALIVSRLRDLGFRQARVLSVNRAVNPDNDKLSLIFNVEEGPRSYIGDIAVTGNTLTTVEQINALVGMKRGDPASITTIRLEANKVLEYYFQRGYALVTISSRLIDVAPQRVKVIYEIKEGPQVYINRVWMNEMGTRQRTRYGRVNTFLRFKAGELLRADRLAESEQDLYALGAFRRVVIRSEPLGFEGETGVVRRDVFVDLDEGKSRNITYGVGYQTDDGARGTVEISDPNVFGRLTIASFRMRVSQRDLLGQLSYTDPRPFGYRLPTLVSALLQHEDRPAFKSRRATALIQVEKRLTDRSLMLFRYSYEDVRVNNPEGVTEREDAPIRLGRVSTSYLIDYRDNPFDATTGRYHTVDFSLASTKFGGSENFFRFFTEHQYYRPLTKDRRTVAAVDFRLGLARRYGELPPSTGLPIQSELLPITERFFTGGSTTLRGYDFEQAGPRDLNDNPIGGNALLILNAELRRPIYRQLALVGFYDTGNVFITASRARFKDFTHSIGIGFRIVTPLGPFRLDLAYLASSPQTGTLLPGSVANQVNLPRFQIHFSFGQAF